MAWLALESDPEIFTNYMRRIGLLEPWTFGELWSLDEAPENAAALVIAHGPCPGLLAGAPVDYGLFIKQIEGLGDACGLIACLHSIAASHAGVQEGSILQEILNSFEAQTPEERGAYLSNHQGLQAQHASISQQGQSEIPSEGATFHFIAVVGGVVYDGLRGSAQRLESESLTAVLHKVRDMVAEGQLDGMLNVMYLHRGE
jgi:ubiquitin carboxyl-terminal hydrolase L3